MKEIERLAEKQTDQPCINNICGVCIPIGGMEKYIGRHDRCLIKLAYMAGFRKAREMAAEMVSRQEWDIPYKILKIGEREVE